MELLKTKVWFVFLLSSCFNLAGQSLPELRDSVYVLSNSFEYEKAQSLVLNFVREHAKHPEVYQAQVILSHTYKRVFDYDMAREALRTASHYVAQAEDQELASASILYELALIEFDLQSYDKAAELMKSISEQTRVKLGPGAQSNLIMQEAYLLYRQGDYTAAATKYEQAALIKQVSDPCHLPMVLGKQMQLYGAMNKKAKLLEVFDRSNEFADSCGILKYKLYNYEVLTNTYQEMGDFEAAGLSRRRMEQVEEQYKAEEHRSVLREHARKRQRSEQQLAIEKKSRRLWLFSLIGLAMSVLLASLILYLRKLRNREQLMRQENEQMQREIDLVLKQKEQKQSESTKGIFALPVQSNDSRLEKDTHSPNQRPQVQFEGLTDRQTEIVLLMLQGCTNREIADILYISENTVKYHTKNIYQSLDIKNRRELILMSKTGS